MEDAVILSSLMPFPPVVWWMVARHAQTVVWDAHEHYGKMSRRSRYRIATAAGLATLSIPLLGGRDQRTPTGLLRPDNRQPWRRTHWRTITAAYRAAPFFEHYEDDLRTLFAEPAELLKDFCTASSDFLKAALGATFSDQWADRYYPAPPLQWTDARDEALRVRETYTHFPPYAQPFGERHGFLPNLSALDLLLCAGPRALEGR